MKLIVLMAHWKPNMPKPAIKPYSNRGKARNITDFQRKHKNSDDDDVVNGILRQL